MCRRYVPIYQCRHRDHNPQPELFLCRRALDAFAWQTKRAPIISLTNGSFVLQKLASRTAGCLRESTTELQLFYQVAPEWCDACLANGQATQRGALLDEDGLPFKRCEVGAWIPWKAGVDVPKRDRTEALERVWVEDLRVEPVRKYWRTIPAENTVGEDESECSDDGGSGGDEDKMEHSMTEETTCGMAGHDGKSMNSASRCYGELISLCGSSPEKK
ncbi:hypothetical protein IWX49DRAFT_558008 [Phyllosticta citricarpa]|uniref:Uncharacterized protein n=2 Tax=Phyllosticta TaxID=121621 RepID=A0ABR1L8N8_9PEZI